MRASAARLTRLATGVLVAALCAAGPAVASPFMPNDVGATGRPGGWAEQQRNFTGP